MRGDDSRGRDGPTRTIRRFVSARRARAHVTRGVSAGGVERRRRGDESGEGGGAAHVRVGVVHGPGGDGHLFRKPPCVRTPAGKGARRRRRRALGLGYQDMRDGGGRAGNRSGDLAVRRGTRRGRDGRVPRLARLRDVRRGGARAVVRNGFRNGSIGTRTDAARLGTRTDGRFRVLRRRRRAFSSERGRDGRDGGVGGVRQGVQDPIRGLSRRGFESVVGS